MSTEFAILYLYTSEVKKSVDLAKEIDQDCKLNSVITTISIDSKEIRNLIPSGIIDKVPTFVIKNGPDLTICDEINDKTKDHIFEIAVKLTDKFGDSCKTAPIIVPDD